MTSNELGTFVHAYVEAAMTTGRSPCMTLDGRPIFPCALITPAAYEVVWHARKPGTRARARCYFHALYASVFVESDDGVEIEVSALVDLNPDGAALDDYRCRLAPDGAEVELDAVALDGLRDRLVVAAEDLCR